MFTAMGMIYGLIMKENKGYYGNTDFRKAADAIFKLNYPATLRSTNNLY